MKYTQETPPICKQCRHPNENDTKRLIFHTIDDLNDSEIGIIRCPSFKCSNGWDADKAHKHIDYPSGDGLNSLNIIRQEAPRCEKCNKQTEDPKRFALVFLSKVHPGVIFGGDMDLPEDFYEEYDEPKSFMTVKCPTLKCQVTFETSHRG